MIKSMKKLFNYFSFVLIIALCAGLFTACGSEPTDLVSNMVTLEYTSVEYDGEEKTPSVAVKIGEETIDSNEYEIKYSNNTKVGTASVKVTAVEGAKSIKGTVTVGFEILTATAETTTLSGIKDAIEDANYGEVSVTSALTIASTETLTIPEDFVVNFGDNILTNDGTIENNGTIIQNKNILGSGTIENNGEIIAEVDTFTELKNAFTYASTTKLVADIGLPTQAEPDGEYLACHTAKYDTITLDINGHTLKRALNFNAEYNVHELKVVNSSENEAVVDVRGLNDCAIYFRHNQAKSTAFDAKVSNITFIGDNAAVKTNGMCKSEDFKISFKDCKFDGGNTTGAYLPAGYNYKFENCEFKGISAYYAKSGVHTLVDCTMIATKSDYSDPTHNNDGCDETGSALILDSSQNYHKPLVVNVDGGSFESKSGYSIEEYATSKNGNFNFYSELNIIKAPSYKYASNKVAVATPTLLISNQIYDVQEKVDEILELAEANYSNLESRKYTVEELKTIITEFDYYIEIGEVKYIQTISSITLGSTTLEKDQVVSVSLGMNNFVNDKGFIVENNKLYIAAPVLLFETQSNNMLSINGKEFRLNLTSKVKQLAVADVTYGGVGNTATAVDGKYNEYDLVVSTASGSSYLEIYYSNASADDVIVTRKDNDGIISYGITSVENKTGNPLGFYVVGYYSNPNDIPTKYEGMALNYSFYVVGKGITTIIFNIDLVNVD